MRRALRAVISGVTATLLGAGVLPAQGPTRIISINPFLPIVGSFQGEFEKKLRDNVSVAVAGSFLAYGDEDDDRFATADVKLRLYPSERALQGLGIAAGAGVGRQSIAEFLSCVDFGACTYRRRSATSPTFVVEMHYQWLLGKQRTTAVTIGGGARRYFGIDEVPGSGGVFNDFMPTLRLTIGYAFR
jgi:hypothetical protein